MYSPCTHHLLRMYLVFFFSLSGSIVIMDSRCHHRGSENNSTKRRPVFYFSLKSKQGKPPTGPTYSMREQYEEKLTMLDVFNHRTLAISRPIDSAIPSVHPDDKIQVFESIQGLARLRSWGSDEDQSQEMEKSKEMKKSQEMEKSQEMKKNPEMKKNQEMEKSQTTITSTQAITLTNPQETEEWPLPIGLELDYNFSDTTANDMLLFSSPLPPEYIGNMPATIQMSSPVVMIDTLTWDTAIRQHPYVLVCFYDPRSAAYVVLKDVYPEAAVLLESVAVVAGVNVAKDSYLTSSMAWELNLANQNPVRQESFHFGRPNYYPMIAHLYKNGTKTVEYTGVQSSKAVAKWVTQMVKSSTSDIGPVVVLTSKDDVEALVLKNIDFPTVVGCFAEEDVAAAALLPSAKERRRMLEDRLVAEKMTGQLQTGKEPSQDLKDRSRAAAVEATAVEATAVEAAVVEVSYNRTHDYQAFLETAEELGGDFVFARLSSELCARTGRSLVVGTATIFVRNTTNAGEMISLSQTTTPVVFHFPNITTIDIDSRRSVLNHFLETKQKTMTVGELSPDNSHTFLDQPEPVLLILCHPEEPTQNIRAKKLAVRLSQSVGDGNILLSWADGPEFASQFNIRNDKKKFPAFLLLAKVESPQRTTMKSNEQLKFDRKTGRLSEDQVEFPTYVYQSSQFGKPSFAHFKTWLNMTQVMPAFNKYNAERLALFYKDPVDTAAHARKNNTKQPSNATDVSHDKTSGVDERLSMTNVTIVNITTNITTNTTTNTTNTTNTTTDVIATATTEQPQPGRGMGPLPPRPAMSRVYENFEAIGTYERLLARKRDEALLHEKKQLTPTEVVMEKGVQKIRQYLLTHHSDILAPVVTPADMEIQANDPSQWKRLKKKIEELDFTRTRLERMMLNYSMVNVTNVTGMHQRREQYNRYYHKHRHHGGTTNMITMEESDGGDSREKKMSTKEKNKYITLAASYIDADVYLEMALTELLSNLEASYKEELGGEVTKEDMTIVHIDVVHWKNLSMRHFMRKYATTSTPVVIRGLPMTRTPWTLNHIKEKCGNQTAMLKQREVNSTNWGGLVDAEELKLGDFIDTFRSNKTRQKYYLHDWSLPTDCPTVMGKPPYNEFLMPRYFAGDYFQRVFPNGYQHTWPSLFIGANGTQSDMHVDSGGTNFWLYLLSGKKEWRFYAQDDQINLYPIRETAKYVFLIFFFFLFFFSFTFYVC